MSDYASFERSMASIVRAIKEMEADGLSMEVIAKSLEFAADWYRGAARPTTQDTKEG